VAHWQLRHPNIVSLIGIYQFEEESFPAMILQRAEHSLAIKYLESYPDSRSFLKLVSSYLIFPPNAHSYCEYRFWAYLMEYVTCMQGCHQSYMVISTMSVLILCILRSIFTYFQSETCWYRVLETVCCATLASVASDTKSVEPTLLFIRVAVKDSSLLKYPPG